MDVPWRSENGNHLGKHPFYRAAAKTRLQAGQRQANDARNLLQDRSHIRIFLRSKNNSPGNAVDITVRNGRWHPFFLQRGNPLDSIHLDREEIERIIGPKKERTIFCSFIRYFLLILQNAVIASEDPRFYFHMGIDLMGIIRSWFASSGNKSLAQSSDTITRQLAKNFFLSPEKTSWRKLCEFEIALILEIAVLEKTAARNVSEQAILGTGKFLWSLRSWKCCRFFIFEKIKTSLPG
jgi:hypothetical protein